MSVSCGSWPRDFTYLASLTDVVVEADESAAEFCIIQSVVNSNLVHSSRVVPLSPFITTQILDPTHLSISSRLWSLIVAAQPYC